MSMTGMLIPMQRPISSSNGRLKHGKNMETDTDRSSLQKQELNEVGGAKWLTAG